MPSLLTSPSLSTGVLRVLATAPHRLLFFVGASNVLLAMSAWTLWLIAARWQVLPLPVSPLPAGWMHAIVMQYLVLPAFMFGFLLTVFPRWMNLPALTRRHYVPVGAGLLTAQLLTLAGMAGSKLLLQLGAMAALISWGIGTAILLRLLYQETGRTWHAVSCAMALIIGWVGLAAYAAYLYQPDSRLMFTAIKLGTTLVVLPIYFTVCHRMIPFFAGAALRDYRPVRPMWLLGAFWPLALAHTWLELRHGYAWLWLPDVSMVLLTGWLLHTWWPRSMRVPALLRVLFVGFAWLPLAFGLYAAQSFGYWLNGAFILGRAPAHALFIGFFGSLLVAMVTRVTQGHSGRPLVLGRVAAFAFIVIQVVAVLRIVAELQVDTLAWQALAAAGWLLAFLPWVIRSAWIYVTPRADGKAG
jgi:uncharacterized protein involved in response to NO